MLTNINKKILVEIVEDYLEKTQLPISINPDCNKIILTMDKNDPDDKKKVLHSMLKDISDLANINSFTIEEGYSSATDDKFYVININEGEE